LPVISDQSLKNLTIQKELSEKPSLNLKEKMSNIPLINDY